MDIPAHPQDIERRLLKCEFHTGTQCMQGRPLPLPSSLCLSAVSGLLSSLSLFQIVSSSWRPEEREQSLWPRRLGNRLLFIQNDCTQLLTCCCRRYVRRPRVLGLASVVAGGRRHLGIGAHLHRALGFHHFRIHPPKVHTHPRICRKVLGHEKFMRWKAMTCLMLLDNKLLPSYSEA